MFEEIDRYHHGYWGAISPLAFASIAASLAPHAVPCYLPPSPSPWDSHRTRRLLSDSLGLHATTCRMPHAVSSVAAYRRNTRENRRPQKAQGRARIAAKYCLKPGGNKGDEEKRARRHVARILFSFHLSG